MREFELNLLDISGYLPNLTTDIISESNLEDNETYVFVNELGIMNLQQLTHQYGYQKVSKLFKGYIWKALFNKKLTNSCNFNAYKTITRFLLKPLIGEKPLNSHKFFTGCNK